MARERRETTRFHFVLQTGHIGRDSPPCARLSGTGVQAVEVPKPPLAHSKAARIMHEDDPLLHNLCRATVTAKGRGGDGSSRVILLLLFFSKQMLDDDERATAVFLSILQEPGRGGGFCCIRHAWSSRRF